MAGNSRAATAEPVYVSLQEASVRLSVSVDTLRDAIARGQLPAFRVGNGRGRLRVRVVDLDTLMVRVPTGGVR